MYAKSFCQHAGDSIIVILCINFSIRGSIIYMYYIYMDIELDFDVDFCWQLSGVLKTKVHEHDLAHK